MQKIKLLNINDTTEHVQEMVNAMKALCIGDTNMDVSAGGTDTGAKSGILTTKTNDNGNAHVAAHNASVAELNQKKATVKAYNKTAKKVMEVYEGDTTKYGDLGFPLTKEATDAVELDAPTGGEAHKSPFPGKIEAAWDVLEGADDYLLEECQGDPTLIDAVWYPASPVSSKTHGARITPKDRNVITSWRVTGENTFGAGAPSDPFGGFKF